jgi:hypothetical protein
MIQSTQNTIAALIAHYGLELEGSQVETIVEPWLELYEPTWIVKAIVESLYRGRYKVNSVDRILQGWKRMGEPRYWFSAEYERGILEKLPQIVAMGFPGIISPIDRSSRQNLGMSPPIFISADDLNPQETVVDEDTSSSEEITSQGSSPAPDTPAKPLPANLPSTSRLLLTLTAIIEPNRQNFDANLLPYEDRADTPA